MRTDCAWFGDTCSLPYHAKVDGDDTLKDRLKGTQNKHDTPIYRSIGPVYVQ